MGTLVSQIVEHTEIDEHLVKIAKNVIVEHLFYTISIATNNRTPGIFFHCINSQTCSTIRDTRVDDRDTVKITGSKRPALALCASIVPELLKNEFLFAVNKNQVSILMV